MSIDLIGVKYFSFLQDEKVCNCAYWADVLLVLPRRKFIGSENRSEVRVIRYRVQSLCVWERAHTHLSGAMNAASIVRDILQPGDGVCRNLVGVPVTHKKQNIITRLSVVSICRKRMTAVTFKMAAHRNIAASVYWIVVPRHFVQFSQNNSVSIKYAENKLLFFKKSKESCCNY